MKRRLDFASKTVIAILICIIFFLFQINKMTDNEIYLYTYLITYFIITLIFICKERKSIVNIRTIFVAMYSIMIGLSPYFYYLNSETLISITGSYITYQYIFILTGYISMIIGFYIFKPKVKDTQIADKVRINYNKMWAYVLLIVSAFFNLYYIYKNKGMLFGGNLEEGRIEAQSSNGIIIILTGLYLLGIGFLYDYVLRTNKSKFLLMIFIIANIVFFIIRGSRTSIVYIFILMIMIRNNYKPIKPQNMVKFCVIILVIIGILQVVRSDLSGKSSSFIKNIYNSLQVGSINFDYVYKTFPNKMNFQFGYTYLINIIMMLPGADPDFTLWLKDAIGINFSGGGVTPTLIGEGYINFGTAGIILAMVITGCLGSLLNEKYNKDKKNLVWISYIIVKIINIFRNGYASIEISFLVLMCIYIAYLLLYSSYKKVYNYSDNEEM